MMEDYISYQESEKFYILEFKNGRYIFFKKELFENKESFDSIIKTIEEKRESSASHQ